MKILIKGAGDLATGIASRLYGAGHQILMTEIEVPLTVRRTVAFSRAVYEGRAAVEDMEAYRAENETEARAILEKGCIAVMVDPTAACRQWYQPDVIVDAILAKKNLGTEIGHAPFVIGVGPGFFAGMDCHCVVETKRGHTLGRIIWRGPAIANTGIPGNIGGYTTQRLLRASADGVIHPLVSIGDYVEEGQVVAMTGGQEVRSQMPGIVRGMLQEGVVVEKGLKIGDVDARAEKSHCLTISDKAKAIGGGVLEAVSAYEKMAGRFAIVILAAGLGKRFGGDKLQALVGEHPMYEHMLRKAAAFGSFPSYIVTGSEEISAEARGLGVIPVENKEPEKGISHSLRLGLQRVMEEHPHIRGVLFSVCDQPNLEISTMQQIFNRAFHRPGFIVCAGTNGKKGNPVFWDRSYFPELLSLTGDEGGKQVMRNYPDRILVVETEEKELKDIDRREDLLVQ